MKYRPVPQVCAIYRNVVDKLLATIKCSQESMHCNFTSTYSRCYLLIMYYNVATLQMLHNN